MFKGSALVQGAGKLMSNFQCAARFEMMIKERISRKFERKTNPAVMFLKL